MPKTRLFPALHRTRAHRGLAAAIAVLGVLALAPASAQALTVDLAFPDPVTAGDAGLTAHLVLTNTSAVPTQPSTIPASVCNGCGSAGGTRNGWILGVCVV